jgi:hypothetical protein
MLPLLLPLERGRNKLFNKGCLQWIMMKKNKTAFVYNLYSFNYSWSIGNNYKQVIKY